MYAQTLVCENRLDSYDEVKIGIVGVIGIGQLHAKHPDLTKVGPVSKVLISVSTKKENLG